MKMTPLAVIVGSVLILATIVFVVVILPYANTSKTAPSEIFRARTAEEAAGRATYIANGCVYCHSQSVRTIDWDLGAERIAQAGDYVADYPILLGSQRTGPDLSQAGGEHPDDWHMAHFINPRYARTLSLMPPFEFLGREKLEPLIRYIQSLGFKDADKRMARQLYWKAEAVKAYEAGPDANVAWLVAHIPQGWRDVPNPYPTSEAGLARGHKIYQDFCLGCHGPVG
ncbi:MAG: cbb3-type cytochrome c oxidase subunit II, partial [Desulfatitalea sp.]|nr:cbb3-type cytochrome c oxidase subunit II [Desulfatitalea sp.]